MNSEAHADHKNIAEVLEYIDDHKQVAIQDVQSRTDTYGFPEVTVTFQLKDD